MTKSIVPEFISQPFSLVTVVSDRAAQLFKKPLIAFAILTAFFSFISSSQAHADTIRGILINESGSALALRIGEQNTIFEIQASPALKDNLRRLKNGDLVVGSGILRPQTSTVELDSVQSVGLRELVGAWKSTRWEIFEFFDFNRLNLYLPKARPDGQVVLTKTHELSYYIAPIGDGFSLFITDPKKVMYGTIAFSDNRLNITVFNTETGKASENISLSPLTLK